MLWKRSLALVLIRKRTRERWQQVLKSNTHMVSSPATQPCTEQYNCKPWRAFRPAFKAKRKVEHEANCETERAIRLEEGCREKNHKLQGLTTKITFNFTSWVLESHYRNFRASKNGGVTYQLSKSVSRNTVPSHHRVSFQMLLRTNKYLVLLNRTDPYCQGMTEMNISNT